jgi:hypothetical protein
VEKVMKKTYADVCLERAERAERATKGPWYIEGPEGK